MKIITHCHRQAYMGLVRWVRRIIIIRRRRRPLATSNISETTGSYEAKFHRLMCDHSRTRNFTSKFYETFFNSLKIWNWRLFQNISWFRFGWSGQTKRLQICRQLYIGTKYELKSFWWKSGKYWTNGGRFKFLWKIKILKICRF